LKASKIATACIEIKIKLNKNSGSGLAKYSLTLQTIINISKSRKFEKCLEFKIVALSMPAIQLEISMVTAKITTHCHPGSAPVP
jgi:hypothetical protein